MRLTQPREDPHHNAPNTDEEGDDKKSDLPLWNRDVPEEAPVPSVRLVTRYEPMLYNLIEFTYPTEPVIAQDFGAEEPKDNLPAEKGPEEVGHFRRCLAVIIYRKRVSA